MSKFSGFQIEAIEKITGVSIYEGHLMFILKPVKPDRKSIQYNVENFMQVYPDWIPNFLGSNQNKQEDKQILISIIEDNDIVIKSDAVIYDNKKKKEISTRESKKKEDSTQKSTKRTEDSTHEKRKKKRKSEVNEKPKTPSLPSFNLNISDALETSQKRISELEYEKTMLAKDIESRNEEMKTILESLSLKTQQHSQSSGEIAFFRKELDKKTKELALWKKNNANLIQQLNVEKSRNVRLKEDNEHAKSIMCTFNTLYNKVLVNSMQGLNQLADLGNHMVGEIATNKTADIIPHDINHLSSDTRPQELADFSFANRDEFAGHFKNMTDDSLGFIP